MLGYRSHAGATHGRRAAGDPLMDTNWFILSSIAGVFGAAYFIYGKKQMKPVALLAGALLVVLPYFIGNIVALIAVCLALLAAPFLIHWDF